MPRTIVTHDLLRNLVSLRTSFSIDWGILQPYFGTCSNFRQNVEPSQSTSATQEFLSPSETSIRGCSNEPSRSTTHRVCIIITWT